MNARRPLPPLPVASAAVLPGKRSLPRFGGDSAALLHHTEQPPKVKTPPPETTPGPRPHVALRVGTLDTVTVELEGQVPTQVPALRATQNLRPTPTRTTSTSPPRVQKR
jgi:hypothetical protein